MRLNSAALPRRRRPVRPLRPDGRRRPVARLLPRLRADEGEDRLDAEQDLSAGSSARTGGSSPSPRSATREARRGPRGIRPGPARPGAGPGTGDPSPESRRDPRRDRHDARAGRRSNIARWARRSIRARRCPVRPPAVPDLDDLPTSKARGEGVLHVTDDVLLLAQAAIGVPVEPDPADPAGERGGRRILVDACRYYEFRVIDLDDRDERTRSWSRPSPRAAARLLRLQPRQARGGLGSSFLEEMHNRA